MFYGERYITQAEPDRASFELKIPEHHEHQGRRVDEMCVNFQGIGISLLSLVVLYSSLSYVQDFNALPDRSFSS